MLEVHGKSLDPHFRQTAHKTGNQGIDHPLSLPQRKTHLLTVICYIKATTNRKENRRREGQEILITAEQTSIILT